MSGRRAAWQALCELTAVLRMWADRLDNWVGERAYPRVDAR